MIKKYFASYTIIVIFFMILLFYNKNLSLDEIWCFGFSKKIANGHIPYKDYNFIQTPLFFYFGSLFSSSLIWFRLFGAMIIGAILILVLYMCEINGADTFFSLIFTSIVALLISIIPHPNYNMLLLFSHMIVYLVSIKFFNKINGFNSFILGMSLSVALLIKQSIPGILIILMTSILVYLLLKKKMSANVFFLYALGGIIPVSIFLLQLLIQHSLLPFVNYGFFGMGSFAKTYRIQYISIIFVLYSLVFNVLCIIKVIKRKYLNSQFVAYLIFCISSYMYIYPLIDVYHSILLLIYSIFISIPYIDLVTLQNRVNKRFKHPQNSARLRGFSITIIALIIISTSQINDKSDYVRSKVKYYENILIDKNLDNNINIVNDYIVNNEDKGLDVAILSNDAYLYTIPSDDNNGVLDLLLKGNIGLMKNKDIILLINSKDIILINSNFTFDTGIEKYVRDNFTEDTMIGNMEVYRVKH